MITIADACVVAIRYIMKSADGTLLENTMDGVPVHYLQGGTRIHPLLQEQLKGLRAGDKKTVWLKAMPGLPGDFFFDVIVDGVRLALQEEILLGYPVQLDASPCEYNCDCYKMPA